MQSLQNGLQPHSETASLFSMRTGSLASSQSCRRVDADAWCKRALRVNADAPKYLELVVAVASVYVHPEVETIEVAESACVHEFGKTIWTSAIQKILQKSLKKYPIIQKSLSSLCTKDTTVSKLLGNSSFGIYIHKVQHFPIGMNICATLLLNWLQQNFSFTATLLSSRAFQAKKLFMTSHACPLDLMIPKISRALIDPKSEILL